jgi:hypothetical protein
VFIDGRPLAAYVHAYLAGGRVFAPVMPLLAQLADRVWFDGDVLVVERGGRRVRVRVAPVFPGQLDGTYVPAGPVLRALGDAVRYNGESRSLQVQTPARVVASPTPFDPTAPSVVPSTVFTAQPAVTPRPVVSGSPLPRRTPLPEATLSAQRPPQGHDRPTRVRTHRASAPRSHR